MKTREKILRVVSLALVLVAVHPLAWAPLAIPAESEAVSPLGFEGNNNTFYGLGAGNSTAGDNDYDTFIGYKAGYSNTTGAYNSFLGYHAGYSNTEGHDNSFHGFHAGWSNTTGNYNTFIGEAAGVSNTTASNNSFVGVQAGLNNTIGEANSFYGFQAGSSNTTASNNSFLGYRAGYSNITGVLNSFFGSSAGFSNTTGSTNSFLGNQAGYSNTMGNYNTYLGYRAGYLNTTGWGNTYLGYVAGFANSTGSGNVFLGFWAGYNETGSNRLYIDNSTTSTPLIYGEFDNRKLTVNGNLQVIGPNNGLVRLSNVTTDSTTKVARMVLNHYSNTQLPLYLFGAASTSGANFVAFGGGSPIGNAATQLDLFTAPNTTTPTGTPRLTIIGNGYVGIGTQTPSAPLQMAGGAYTNGASWFNASSREYKDNIKDLRAEDAMETLKGLNPVTFNYKASANEGHVGFIAEEVPELVATKDRKGLSPMDIVAVLTKVVKEQQAIINAQQKTNEEQRTLNINLMNKLAQLEAKLESLQASGVPLSILSKK